MAQRIRKREIASKVTAPAEGPQPPFDLEAVKAANRHHHRTRYGKPIAPRFLPGELDQLNLLRGVLPADVAPYAARMSDAAVVKACFKLACKQLLKPARSRARGANP